MSKGKTKANWNFATRILQSFPKRRFFFREISFALPTVGRVTGDKGNLKANWSCLNLSNILSNALLILDFSRQWAATKGNKVLSRNRPFWIAMPEDHSFLLKLSCELVAGTFGYVIHLWLSGWQKTALAVLSSWGPGPRLCYRPQTSSHGCLRINELLLKLFT